MGIDVKITDGQGTGNELSVLKPQTELPHGILTFTEPYRKGKSSGILYSNSTFGIDLNQDAGFTGTPVGVHNGTDTVEWTASALSGTWTFDSTTQAHTGTKSIDASAAGNNREASISDGTGIAQASYVALSGWIYITSWTLGSSEVSFRTRDTGVEQGNTLNLSSYISPGIVGSWQKFSIPMDDFGLINGATIDELVIKQESAAPNYFLDDMQWEETGGSIAFTIEPRAGTRFHLENVTFFVAATENSTLADASMQNVTYTEFFGISALAVGITLESRTNGTTSFTGLARDIGDLLLTCSEFKTGGDGTTTWYKMTTDFPGARDTLDSRNDDARIIRVNDDLSSLLRFRVLVNGWEEQISDINETTLT